MPFTGIAVIPPQPSALTPLLINHISNTRPELDQQPYHLEHLLFNDTSSQLPGSTERAYTHLLSSTHDSSAFVASTLPSTSAPSDLEIITIPKSDFDGFGTLISQKFQPLWYSRTVNHVDGVHVKFKVGEKQLELCVGEVKVKGLSRGTVVEVYYAQAPESDAAQSEAMFREILNQLFEKVSDFSQTRIVSRETMDRAVNTDGGKGEKDPDWNLAKLYMLAFTPGGKVTGG